MSRTALAAQAVLGRERVRKVVLALTLLPLALVDSLSSRAGSGGAGRPNSFLAQARIGGCEQARATPAPEPRRGCEQAE